MRLIKKFYNFLNHIFSSLTVKSMDEVLEPESVEEISDEVIFKQLIEKPELIEKENSIDVARRTLMTRLYILEQEIVVFENDFPKEHQAFMERIENLRESYNSSLEETSKLLTFEIDPELDFGKTGEVLKLERDIKKFIEKEVKFNIISKRLQRLITKLNILYNVSIFHCGECEKEKVLSQLKKALETEIKIVREFKECSYILEDKQLKERIVNLISYVDYEIFKTNIRNSKKVPIELFKNLVMITEFDKFDYVGAFVAFAKDEISDLNELLPLISDEEYRKILTKKLTNLLTELTYSDNIENEFCDTVFWDDFKNFESSLFEILKMNNVEKEKIKVRIISNMNISIDEKEVVVLPITNACLSLTSIYVVTQDKKILLVIKLLRNISNDVTYKEIYFLLLLFDAIGIIEKNSNELIRHIEKYLKKYPYDRKTIEKKKEFLINSSNKEYVVVFKLNDYEKEIITTLENLNIDFKVVGSNVFINAFYFNGLENVQHTLQKNTENMMI